MVTYSCNFREYVMLTRSLREDLLKYLKHFPSVLIAGARQVGKSTLAMSLGIDNYVTFDDITSYESAKTDPKGFVSRLPKPVIIDEIQKVPDIFPAVKEWIDGDRKPGTFVLTGSTNLQGFKNISESLAGRIGIIDLYPLNLAEIYQSKTNLVDMLISNDLPAGKSNVGIEHHIIRGGYPEIREMDDKKLLYLWFSSYISTYIERDARDIGDIRNLDSFMKLYKNAAFRSGSLMNKSELSKECGIDNKTLDNYLTILKNTYQVSLLAPYFSNELKRLVKTPKIYMCDSGILAHLLRVTSPEQLAESEYKGMLYETFVFDELLKANAYAEDRVEISFYRTSDGVEVDFILDSGRSMAAIEVKSSKSVSSGDFKNIKYAADSLRGKLKYGYVMYSGSEVMSFGQHAETKLFAIPYSVGHIK
jgi:hypothetical protein